MNIWTAIYRISWIALIILGLVGTSVFIVPKWREFRDYQRRTAEKIAKKEDEDALQKLLRTKQERFRTDPRFVERMARDLGLAHSNEVLFRYDADTVPGAPGRTTPPRRP